jgi:hypothetical protein
MVEDLSKGLAGERHALFDPIFIGWMHRSCASETAAAFRILGLEQMPLAGAGSQHFSSGGNLKPLRCRFLSFDAFGTSHKFKQMLNRLPKKDAQYRGRTEERQGVF